MSVETNKELATRFADFLQFSKKTILSRNINPQDYQQKWYVINSYEMPYDKDFGLVSTKSFKNNPEKMIEHLEALDTTSSNICYFFSLSLTNEKSDDANISITSTRSIIEQYDDGQCTNNIYSNEVAHTEL